MGAMQLKLEAWWLVGTRLCTDPCTIAGWNKKKMLITPSWESPKILQPMLLTTLRSIFHFIVIASGLRQNNTVSNPSSVLMYWPNKVMCILVILRKRSKNSVNNFMSWNFCFKL